MKPLTGPLAPLLLLALTSNAAHAESGWIEDTNGCKHFNQVQLPEEKVIWTGGCVNGFAEGRGERQWFVKGSRTAVYEGDMKAGRRTGQGRNVRTSGLSYEGGYEDEDRSGHGVSVGIQGERCEGEFKYDALLSPAVCTWPNGDRHEGAYFASVRWGKGVFTGANGYRYEGDFESGQPSGQGKARSASGFTYEGQFVLGRPWGVGTVRDAAGQQVPSPVPDDVMQGLIFKLATPSGERVAVKSETRATGFREGVCTRMPAPRLPQVPYKGMANLGAVAIVRDGKVVDARAYPRAAFINEKLRKDFVEAVETAMRSYECPGNQELWQYFQFELSE